MNIFDTFLEVSGLKPNKNKCEIAGIGALREVQVALCGMRCNNDKLEIQENFKKHIIKIEKNFTNLEHDRSFNCGQNYCL